MRPTPQERARRRAQQRRVQHETHRPVLLRHGGHPTPNRLPNIYTYRATEYRTFECTYCGTDCGTDPAHRRAYACAYTNADDGTNTNPNNNLPLWVCRLPEPSDT
jgi:hypothetical protein